MKKNIIPLFVFGVLMSCESSRTNDSAQEELDKKPNILLILADDAGYADFGFMGSDDMVTPNIDSIAASGVRFTDAHVSASVCSPSRAGMLTGLYQQRFGHELNLRPNQPLAFDSAQVTIAEALSRAGYRTSIFGKWHLGEAPHQHPNENGFDYFWGFLSGHRSYYPLSNDSIHKDMWILENDKPVSFDGYLTDALGDQAVQYLERSNDESPFFMFLSFNAPHTPMEADAKHDHLFEGHPRATYASMVYSMDLAIGRVIQKLKEQGQYEKTLIFFLSDNGGSAFNNSSVFPLKGWKGNQYEGGTRVPFVLSWPEQIKANQSYAGLTSSLDIYATAVSVAGISPSTLSPLDGVDLVPIVKQPELGPAHDKLFWRQYEMASARVGNFKLLTVNTSGDSDTVLYDLEPDLGEINDLSKSSPEIKKRLAKELDNWQAPLKSKIWGGDDDWHEVSKSIIHSLMENKEPTVFKPSQLKKNIESNEK